VENNASSDKFAFSNTFDLEVFNARNQIKSGIGYCKIVTHNFNTILTTSIHSAAWKTSKIMPITKKNEPNNMSDYTPISVLPAFSKTIETVMKRQINALLLDKGLVRDY
jgi:hypothetical protein